MASPTSKTWTKRNRRDAKKLKRRQTRLRNISKRARATKSDKK